ncbi:MAG: M20/M25/M40 family metallo-hydrolase, partial [Chloroflexia bacterium]|nr:M20/M25/M40 family metallo-hydrolase [Chloroflexia bacterium]
RTYAKEHMADMVRDLSEFCALPSMAGQPQGLNDAAAWVARSLEDCGLSVRRLESGGPTVIQAQRLRPGRPTVLFYNHYDVQPPGDEDAWRFPPFEPRQHGRRLYARGAVDNKGALVARLWALRAWRELYGELPLGVRFVVEGEEEIGSPHLPALLQEHGPLFQADGCIWEAGGVGAQARPLLYLGMKGVLYVELEARGTAQALHSSWGTVAPNPAWRLLWAISSLKSPDEDILIEGFYDTVDGPSREDIRQVQELPFDQEALLEAWQVPGFLAGLSGAMFLLAHFYAPSCNLDSFQSGQVEHIHTALPNVARAHLDFRLVPDQQPEEILDLLRRHLEEQDFADIVVRPLGPALRPFRTPLEHPFVQAVVEATRTVFHPRPAIFPTSGGSGPMYLFGQDLGLPVVSLGVGHLEDNVHGADENVRLVDLERGVAHVAAIMERLAQGPAQ